MRLDKDVCKENIEQGAMCALLAVGVVTVAEAIVLPSVLIQEILLLHLMIAAGALFIMARCIAGPFAHRRYKYIENLRSVFYSGAPTFGLTSRESRNEYSTN